MIQPSVGYLPAVYLKYFEFLKSSQKRQSCVSDAASAHAKSRQLGEATNRFQRFVSDRRVRKIESGKLRKEGDFFKQSVVNFPASKPDRNYRTWRIVCRATNGRFNVIKSNQSLLLF